MFVSCGGCSQRGSFTVCGCGGPVTFIYLLSSAIFPTHLHPQIVRIFFSFILKASIKQAARDHVIHDLKTFLSQKRGLAMQHRHCSSEDEGPQHVDGVRLFFFFF